MKHQIAEELLDQVVNVNLPLGALLSLNGSDAAATTLTRVAALRTNRPDIGDKGLHGIYAGIARGYGDELDGIIEVLDEAPNAMPWEEAKKWSESIGGLLPTRKEQALLFANVPELFQKEAYWSCEPYAGDESCAWCQTFGNGNQYDYGKDNKLRARAVRRLPLE